LPDKLSYTITSTTSPKGFSARLPRRELFDVRVQLMAEDDIAEDSSQSSHVLSGLDDSDISTNVYEGGYKTWECSIDLVKFLLDRGPRKDLDDLVRVNHVIEMGCGTALPSLLLFQYALRNRIGLYFTLMDYNADVLRLVTLPNLLLTFVSTLPATEAPFTEDDPNPLAPASSGLSFASGDLEVSPRLIALFKQTLLETGINITLISGSWTPVPSLLQLIPSAPELNTFILGSETIYSPASLEAFTEAMSELMKRVKGGKAIVAAKRVYFGVGGSVDGFREECAKRGCVAYEMEFEGLEKGGVRRCLVEVQMY
jgi:protein-histidine N-methyltransferase